jgi:iron complex outermembrane recepter protein
MAAPAVLGKADFAVFSAWADESAFEAIADAPAGAEPERAPEPTKRPPVRIEASSKPRRTSPPTIGMEEFVIQARKRAEPAQQTPISVAVFRAGDIEAQQITQITDINEAASNVKFDTTNSFSNQARVYIRGVGQDDFRTQLDPGVGIYVDGIYLPRLNGSVVSTLDLEQIEVLRGPQGTLFGKNTVGGVVSLRTKAPEPEFGGAFKVKGGNFDLFETQGTVNVPLITDRLLSRFSVETQTDDGYSRNGGPADDRSGDNKLLKGRLALRFLATEDLSIDLMAEGTRENEKTPLPECRLTEPFAAGRLIADNLGRTADGRDFQTACTDTRADGEELTSAVDDDTKNDLDTFLVGNTITWDLGVATFKSISSWRRVETNRLNRDFDGSPADAFGLAAFTEKHDAISQELQVTGVTLADRLTYTGGAYFLDESSDTMSVRQSLDSTLAAIRNGTTDQIILPGTQAAFGIPLSFQAADMLAATPGNPTPLTDTVFGLNQLFTERFQTRSYAGYLEGTYKLTERLGLTGGARYTAERKYRQGKTLTQPDAPLFANGQNFSQPILGIPIDDRFDKWTGRVQLEFQATDDVFTYATYSRGFKSGGFNATTFNPAVDPRTTTGKFDEEVLDSYEIGFKSKWLDDTLVLNVAAFYNDYDDIQVSATQLDARGLPVIQIANASEAIIKGVELDFQYRPLPQLTISGGVGHTNADFNNFVARQSAVDAFKQNSTVNFDICKGLTATACPSPADFLLAAGSSLSPGMLGIQDFSDNNPPNAPNFDANVAVDYVFDLETWGALRARTSYFYQGDVEYSIFNDDNVRQNKYGLLNGRLAWDLWDGQTTIALFGRNLLDRRYIAGGEQLSDSQGVDLVFFGRPRTYGIEVLRRF